jgi:hypothetical protein
MDNYWAFYCIYLLIQWGKYIVLGHESLWPVTKSRRREKQKLQIESRSVAGRLIPTDNHDRHLKQLVMLAIPQKKSDALLVDEIVILKRSDESF